MRPSQAAKRYGRALFRLAEQEGALEPVYADIQGIAAALRDCPALAALLDNPVILPDQRDAVFTELFEGQAHPLTLRFLRFLDHHRGRASELAGVCQVFDLLACEAAGIQPVEVVSASPLSPDQTATLQTRLEKRLGTKIRLGLHEQPDLLGGFTVRVHDTMYDYSIASALRRARAGILEGAV